MEMISPSGAIYQAGTFSGSPCSMAAGIAMLDYLKQENIHEKLNSTGNYLRDSLSKIVEDLGLDYNVCGIASMFKIFFGEEPHNYQEVLKCDKEGYLTFFHRMLESGIFLPPSQFETNFISAAHSKEDIENTLEVYAENLLIDSRL
jgi:glutamate-1-semialdehyde 2,1-aminomutase